MFHYDPATALVELNEDGLLPNAVRMRDMVFRAHLAPDESIEVNRRLQEYIQHYGEALEAGRQVLEGLTRSKSDETARTPH